MPGRAVQEERVVGVGRAAPRPPARRRGRSGCRRRSRTGRRCTSGSGCRVVAGAVSDRRRGRRAAPGLVAVRRALPVGADDLDRRTARRSERPRRGAGGAGSARRPRCGCARARARRRCGRATAASSSGSIQMWNLKSGVSRRSSSRMSSQISSGCAGTGGRDPPEGLGRMTVHRGRDGRDTSLQPPSARRVYTGPNRSEPGVPEAAPQNARKASRARIASGVVHRNCTGATSVDLVPWLAYP